MVRQNSFGVFGCQHGDFRGMGDFFSGSGSLGVVATVGSTNIQVRDLRIRLEQQLAHIQDKIGKRFTPEELAKTGLPRAVLTQMIHEALLDLEVERLGLGVSDEAVRNAILSNPNFQNDKKEFSRERFEYALRAMGTDEKAFLETLKKEMCRAQLLSALGSIIKAPSAIAQLWAKAQTQKRFGGLLLIDPKSMVLSKQPSQKDLLDFYTKEKERFRMPEKRGFTYGLLSFRRDTIPVSEEEIRAELAKKTPDRIQTHEDASQAVWNRKAKTKADEIAPQIEDDLASGETFESLSQKYKLGSQTFDPQEKNAWIKAHPRVLEAVFNLTKEGETVVVHFGESAPGHYAVVHLDKILSSHIPPFGEISDKVKKIWIQKAQAKKAVALGKQRLEEIRLGQIKDSAFRVLPGVSLSSKQAPAGVPEEVQTALFDLAPGQSRMVQSVKGDLYIVKLFQVQDQSGNEPAAKLKDGVYQMVGEDVEQAYKNSLGSQTHIKVNKDALASVTG